MRRDELKNAFTPVPQDFYETLVYAAHSVQEDRPMRKKTWVIVLALLLVLAGGTALAIANYYSVREFQAKGNPSQAFESHVIAVDKAYENDYIKMTVTDAVFDGQSFAMAMNLESKDPAKQVFLIGTLTAACDGRELAVTTTGGRGDPWGGMLYPAMGGKDLYDGMLGVEAIIEDAVDGPVTWTVKMTVMKPNWPLVENTVMLYGTENDPSPEAYTDMFKKAYDNQEIMVAHKESLAEYAMALPIPEGIGEDNWYQMYYGGMLAASGAFTDVDTIECTFIAPSVEDGQTGIGKGLSFPFDKYTVEFQGLDLTFLEAQYTFDMVFPEDYTEEQLNKICSEMVWDGTLYHSPQTASGGTLGAGGASTSEEVYKRDDGKWVIRCTGQFSPSPEGEKEVVFMSHELLDKRYVTVPEYAFTVPLTTEGAK